MKFHFRFCLVLLLSLTVFRGFSQSIERDELAQKTFGLDPLLHNGKVYRFFIAPGTRGTPFFNGPDFVNGSVKLRGILYHDVLLKYDIYNQQLVYQYYADNGGVNQIILSDAWLESFDLFDKHFEIVAAKDSAKKIFQTLGRGKVKACFYWDKNLYLSTQLGATNFEFSEPNRYAYLLLDNQLIKYNNNKSFFKAFPAGYQSVLRKYLRQQNVNMKKASEEVIIHVLDYCNKLLAE
ncbi:MAG: hypothetical protein M9948_14330 [Lentimicrobium sp.]|nr:hypothetical protein [Lentimicrobium sp.]